MNTYETRLVVVLEHSWDGDQQVVLKMVKEMIDIFERTIKERHRSDPNIPFDSKAKRIYFEETKGEQSFVELESSCVVLESITLNL